MKNKYIERTGDGFYSRSKNSQTGSEYRIRHQMVIFVPAEDNDGIFPPMRKGTRDSQWVTFNPERRKIDPCNKKQCESLIGVKLLPLKTR